MSEQKRERGASSGGAKNKAASKGQGPKRFQGIQKGKAASSGLKAGVFAQMREPFDLVAFGTPGRPNRVRLYEEVLEVFRTRDKEPRNLVVIMCESPQSDKFEAFQVSFEKAAPLLKTQPSSASERPHWNFVLRGRTLIAPGGVTVDVRKVEKRDARQNR